MNRLNFKKSRLTLAITMLLGTGTPSLVIAVEAEQVAEKVEVISVTGIRGSYMRSSDMKRENSGIVDGISAEDIGKFPDTNLAESLGRITGITVSRTNGEGSEITARGFGSQFNLILLNGRQMPGTGNTRSYDLSNLSSEGVSALETYKTTRVDSPTGGLGATVNIKTTKPLDSPGQRFSVMAKGIHDTSVETGSRVTPEVSAIYSNTFMDETFGVAFSFSNQQRDFRQQSANIQGWHIQDTRAGNGLPELDAANVIDNRPVDEDSFSGRGAAFLPKDMNFSFNDIERSKTNGQITLQYAPATDLVATLDYTFTDASTATNGFGWGIWNDFGSNINGYELDENGTAVYLDISGNDGSFTASRNTTEVKARSVGFNLEWQASESLNLVLDYHDSSNEIDNGADSALGSDGQIILGSDQLETKIYDYRTGEIPHAEILWRNGTNQLMPNEIDSNFSQFIHSPGESTVEQLQLKGSWDSPFDGPLVNVDFGMSRTKQTLSGYQAWSGLRGGVGFNPSFTEVFPDSMFTRQGTGNLLDAFEGGGSHLQPNYFYTFDFNEALARQEAMLTEAILGDNYYKVDAYFDGIDSESAVQEKTTSAYLKADFEFYVMNRYLYVNTGIRYETTDVTGKVRQPVEKQVNWEAPSEWIMHYQEGDDTFLTSSGEHDVWLPSLDLRLDITDDVIARASWGKTMARSDLGPLSGGQTLTGSPKPGARTGSKGNTNLQPYISNNFDLSLEWYLDEGSYVSVGYFKKDVKNYIENEVNDVTIAGLHDILNGPRYNQAVADIEARDEQATTDAIFNQMKANLGLGELDPIQPTSEDPLIVWSVNQPVNAGTRKVDGIELAVQYLFGESGLGFAANTTFVDGNVHYDPKDIDGGQTILPGIGDSANLQIFYEKNGLSVKGTYSWRDAYIIGLGQDQGSTEDQPPQYAKEFGQLDMSVNYDVTDHFTLFFDGVNLNNETEQGYGRYEEQFLFARQYGPRYVVGVRYKFD